MIIYVFVRFDIPPKNETMKKCMKTSLIKKKNIIDCGKELNRDGEFNAMMV